MVQKRVFSWYSNSWRGASHFVSCPDVLDTMLPLWGGSKLHGARDAHRTLCLIQSSLVSAESWKGFQNLVSDLKNITPFQSYRPKRITATKLHFVQFQTFWKIVKKLVKNFSAINVCEKVHYHCASALLLFHEPKSLFPIWANIVSVHVHA